MINEIEELIRTEINPQLALHAGGCELVDVEDGVVTLKLFGGCSGCPSSQITLFNGIVPIFRQHLPEVKDVMLAPPE